MGCNNIPPSCAPSHPRSIPPFCGFTEFTPTIPKLYWNVKSQEQRILRLCELIDKVICYANYLGDEVNIDHEAIAELQRLFQEFQEHGFEEYYEQQLEAWINEHMPEIISQAIKMVFFGLTEDGYFCAWIPKSWHGIIFDTIADYTSENYGCLVLSY